MRYDLVVIGSGPGGHGASIQAAKLGKKVAVVEKRQTVGGVTVNTGTLPSKTLREAVIFLTGYLQRGLYGVSYRVKKDITIQDLTYRTGHVIKDQIQVLEDQYARNNIELIYGEAHLANPFQVQVKQISGQILNLDTEKVILAVGSIPAHSNSIPVNQSSILDSDGILSLSAIPQTLTVVGAGAVGMEYASLFAALGTEVSIIDMRNEILPMLDREITQTLTYHLRQNRVVFRLGEEVTQVLEEDARVIARTKSHKTLRSQALLYTVGRNGATQSLGLDETGITTDARGRILVNQHYQTNISHIYAVGDVIGSPALASTSQEQGRRAARHAFGLTPNGPTHLLPIGIYTIPEISMVGKTEAELTHNQVPYEFGVAKYSETARGRIIGDDTGLLKLLFHSEDHKLLGVHIIGEGASELVHIGQTAMALGGTLELFVENVFNYPTLAECYKIAALDAFNKLT